MTEIPRIAVTTKRAEDKNLYDVTGRVSLEYGATVSGENPSEEDIEEIKAEMQRSFEEMLLDIAALILKKWGEGLFPIARRLNPDEPTS